MDFGMRFSDDYAAMFLYHSPVSIMRSIVIAEIFVVVKMPALSKPSFATNPSSAVDRYFGLAVIIRMDIRLGKFGRLRKQPAFFSGYKRQC